MSRTLAALASLLLTVLGVVFLYPDCAYACSCGAVSTQRLISSSEGVFSGQVTAIEKETATRTTTATLRVSEVWKGPKRATLEVSTPSDEAACGYTFEEGQEYLVYAYGKQHLKVDACSGPTHLSKADEALALLGNGEKLKDGGNALTDTSGVVPAQAVVGLAGLLMAAASLLLVVRLVRTG